MLDDVRVGSAVRIIAPLECLLLLPAGGVHHDAVDNVHAGKPVVDAGTHHERLFVALEVNDQYLFRVSILFDGVLGREIGGEVERILRLGDDLVYAYRVGIGEWKCGGAAALVSQYIRNAPRQPRRHRVERDITITDAEQMTATRKKTVLVRVDILSIERKGKARAYATVMLAIGVRKSQCRGKFFRRDVERDRPFAVSVPVRAYMTHFDADRMREHEQSSEVVNCMLPLPRTLGACEQFEQFPLIGGERRSALQHTTRARSRVLIVFRMERNPSIPARESKIVLLYRPENGCSIASFSTILRRTHRLDGRRYSDPRMLLEILQFRNDILDVTRRDRAVTHHLRDPFRK